MATQCSQEWTESLIFDTFHDIIFTDLRREGKETDGNLSTFGGGKVLFRHGGCEIGQKQANLIRKKKLVRERF